MVDLLKSEKHEGTWPETFPKLASDETVPIKLSLLVLKLQN